MVEVNPQTTVLVPRPMPDEVLVVTVDANGLRGCVPMSKKSFAEIDGDLLALMEETAERIYKEGGTPVPEAALLPETLDAYKSAREAVFSDCPVKAGDHVAFRDPRQQPGVPRSDDVT